MVERSIDLRDWSPINTDVGGGATVEFTDSKNWPVQFYRARKNQ
jgi:hypothetical protein